MKHPVTVIYHSADFDGIFCREIARRYFGENANYIGWNFGEPKISVPMEGQIYILDLSPECLDAPYGDLLPSILERITWIDHHKSAIERWPKTIVGYRIDGVAACRLAWQWFFNDRGPMNPNLQEFDYQLPTDVQFKNREVSEPIAVRLAGEYDIWDKRDPNAETFQFGLRSKELTDADWAMLFNSQCYEGGQRGDFLDSILDAGRILQRYQRERDASSVKQAFDIIFEGRTFLALNAGRCNSLTFEAATQPHHEGLLGFFWDGKEWSISLYHSPHHKEVDLSEIAVKYGGGGHRGACGFRTKRLPFVLL